MKKHRADAYDAARRKLRELNAAGYDLLGAATSYSKFSRGMGYLGMRASEIQFVFEKRFTLVSDPAIVFFGDVCPFAPSFNMVSRLLYRAEVPQLSFCLATGKLIPQHEIERCQF
jgi:hypothetical protein